MSELRGQLRMLFKDSLLGRIVLVMAVGVISAQLVGTLIWARQLRESVRAETLAEGLRIAVDAARAAGYFANVPEQHREQLLEELRGVGSTRFFFTVNQSRLAVEPLADRWLDADLAASVGKQFMQSLATNRPPDVVFARSNTLRVTDDGRKLVDMPGSWLEPARLPLQRSAAAVLAIQFEFSAGQWLLLVAPMPDPWFVDYVNPFAAERLALQLLTLVTVLVLTVLIVRVMIKPLDRIADAANAFGGVTTSEPIAETGSAELRRTARAFNGMQARIKGYLLDRERLFSGISHGLKTPIMRLKLRTELLDDDAMRAEFHEDLDDLDMMVKSALQSLRDTDIHENSVPLRLDKLLDRLVRRPIYPDASISYSSVAVRIKGKPLALERAFGNLLDNGVLYGQRIQVRLSVKDNQVWVEIRDFGPGIPESSQAAVFEPNVRLNHGLESNRSGSGLGMGISRNIIQAQSGEIRLNNHPEGGLVVTVILPALPDEDAATPRAV